LGIGCCHCLASLFQKPVYNDLTDFPSGHFLLVQMTHRGRIG